MSSKTTLVARKSTPYDGVLYRPGDQFNALDRHAKLLIAFGAATEVKQEPELASTKEPELDELFDIGSQPQPTRRQRRQQYSTRELRAREV